MSDSNAQLEAVTIVPGTLLGALFGMKRDGSHRSKQNYLYTALFNQNDGLLNHTMATLNAQPGIGLLMYALGFRTYREIERVARERRLRGN